MKIQPIFVTFASVLSGWVPISAAQDDSLVEADFLRATRQVESGDRYNAPPGRNGELGAYQFRRQVWRRYTRAPFSAARTPLADRIAARHYAWIRQRLEAAGFSPTYWNIAAAWNGGVRAVCSGRIPRSTRDYATRVQNLASEEEAGDQRSLARRLPDSLAGRLRNAVVVSGVVSP
jgi:hypothetical protein